MHLFRKLSLLVLAGTLLLNAAIAADNESNSWTKKSQSIAGTWKIENDTLTLTGFSTRKAPDLKIFLSPQTVAKLSNRNAEEGAVLIAPLKSPKGDQSYPLPPDLDLTAYRSILIHCKKYSKLWGAAAL
jgi:hypothetical protein